PMTEARKPSWASMPWASGCAMRWWRVGSRKKERSMRSWKPWARPILTRSSKNSGERIFWPDTMRPITTPCLQREVKPKLPAGAGGAPSNETMSEMDKSMALGGQPPKSLTPGQTLATVVGLAGLGIMLLALFNQTFPNRALSLGICLAAIALGVLWFSWEAYAHRLPGIKNDGVWMKSISSRGLWAWALGLVLTGFSIVLYF